VEKSLYQHFFVHLTLVESLLELLPGGLHDLGTHGTGYERRPETHFRASKLSAWNIMGSGAATEEGGRFEIGHAQRNGRPISLGLQGRSWELVPYTLASAMLRGPLE
jgi:hypothetical protein